MMTNRKSYSLLHTNTDTASHAKGIIAFGEDGTKAVTEEFELHKRNVSI